MKKELNDAIVDLFASDSEFALLYFSGHGLIDDNVGYLCASEVRYYEDRKLDKGQFVRFSVCQYIERGHHIVLKGASGNGKTYGSAKLTI